eukprot:TRINITY_DN8235_c0_g1_i1.p1 TRINITY_DN8235_c0_g1~~TRINITY_DN8235_c0_g1_i1.p1  ORF type:complete len:822 (+),score=134.10 TRINITY_DN8235_c0_g1_i1:135-2600(+)
MARSCGAHRFWLLVLLVQLLRSDGSTTSAATAAVPSRNLLAVLDRGGLNEEVASGNCTAEKHQVSFLQVSVEGLERKPELSILAALKAGFGRPTTSSEPQRHQHRVQHMAILKDAHFWWFIAFLIALVAIAVVMVEVTKAREVAREIAKEGAPRESAPESSSEMEPSSDLAEEQESMFTSDTMKKLLFCVVGLNAAQIFWGISQEYVMTTTFTSKNGTEDKMPDPLFLVLCNRLLSILFSALLLGIREKPFYFKGYRSSIFPAATNTVASWCQYWSLDYISFELQTAAKTAKLLPVVIISAFRGKQYSLQDFAEAIAITASCFVFGLETETDSRKESFASQAAYLGVALVLANILLDAMTPHFQDVMFKETPELDTVQATFAMSCFSAVMLFVFLLASGSLFSCLNFMITHPDAGLQIFVLSLGSTLTQYMISLTVKLFGPVVYAVISSLRQVLSVLISGVLFVHPISDLAWVTLLMMVGTVIIRAWRSMPNSARVRHAGTSAFLPRLLPQFFASFAPLLVYTVGIHVFYVSYGLLQEFLAYHTFNAKIFRFPVFIVLVDHAAGALLSFCMLTQQGLSIWGALTCKTALPGLTNMSASVLQHTALYSIVFTAQTLMKTVKIIPVMLVGSFLTKNRSYTALDYADGLFLTFLVSYFAWYFESDIDHDAGFTSHEAAVGLVLMLGYVLVDAFTSNLEDLAYQSARLDPSQLVFGMESVSAVVCLLWAILTGELLAVIEFLCEDLKVCSYVLLLAISAAFGAYTCALTVRYYGPAVFTLIMTSRQVFSMVASVIFFGHNINWHHGVCLMVVMLMILTSSLRRAS